MIFPPPSEGYLKNQITVLNSALEYWRKKEVKKYELSY
jgi:hypothetical protein